MNRVREQLKTEKLERDDIKVSESVMKLRRIDH